MTEQNLLFTPAEPTLEDAILELEGRLNRDRAGYAENAFGIGCRATTIPVFLVVGLAFILGVREWTVLIVVLIITAMIAFILVSLFANQAQANATRRIFHTEIEPALLEFQQRFNRTNSEVLAASAAILPAQATLRSFLDLPTSPEVQSLGEPPVSSTDNS